MFVKSQDDLRSNVATAIPNGEHRNASKTTLLAIEAPNQGEVDYEHFYGAFCIVGAIVAP